MRIIEAMKQVKDLSRKADDLVKKISEHAADLDIHTPVYEDQAGQVSKWLQAHGDIVREICRLRTAIQRTNVQTQLTIELAGKQVTKCLAEWLHRRREYADKELEAWKVLINAERGGKLREGKLEGPTGDSPVREIKIRRYYSPEQRDRAMEALSSEPSIIDGKLEIANAVTDIVE